MTTKPQVLLTGSSGRVGQAIAEALCDQYEIAGLDLVPGRFTTHLGTVTDPQRVAEALRDAVAVIHTASLHAPHVGIESDARFRAVNVEGTRLLLEAMGEARVGRLVYTSSTSVYGHALEPDDEAVWVTEELEPRPRDIYDETKLAAETLCRQAAEEGLLSCTALRISRCFPEPDHLVATYRLYRGVDLRDVGQAHRLALEQAGHGYEVYNVSARSPFRREDCAELLRDGPAVLRRRTPWLEAAFRARSWPVPARIDRVYVVDKAGRELGYAPRFNLDTSDCLTAWPAPGRVQEPR